MNISHPTMRTWFRSAVAWAMLAIFSLSAAPQTVGGDAAQIKQPALQYDVAVTLKLIQVFVTDKKGRPLADLGRDEFRVFDNGREVKISEFERHTAEPTPKAQPTSDSPNSVESTPAVTRKFLLFFDFAFNTGKGIEKAMAAANHFLDNQVSPDDEVGVMSFSLGKGMKIHELFTADHAQVRRVIGDMTVKDAAGRFENMEDMYWADEMVHTMGGESPPAPEFRGTGSSGQVALSHNDLLNQTRMYLDRLSDLARALRYVPGQKNLIHFSTGIPYTMFYGLGLQRGDYYLRLTNLDTIKEMASANVSFFVFDTREQSKPVNMFGRDDLTFASGAGRDMGGTDSHVLYTDERITGRSTLEEYAKKTGGEYFGNIREYERSLEQVHSLTGTSYVLGYSVREKWDGRYHELKVETTRPGVNVHAQAGYFNPRPFESFSKLEKEMHLFDLAMSDKPVSQAPKPAEVAALAGPGGGLSVLARLALETVEALRSGQAEVVAFLFDEEGQVASLGRIEHYLSPYKGRSLLFALPVRLNPGGYSCRVVVRDMETGVAAVGTTRATVPGEQTEAVRLHSPLILTECGGGMGAAAAAAAPVLVEKAAGRGDDAPSCLAAYPWEVGRFAPALGPIPRGTPSIRVVLPCTIMDDTPVGLRAILVDSASSGRTELPLVQVGHAQTGHTVTETYEILTADLRAGDYILYFHAVSEEKPLSHAWVRLTIR